MSQEIRESSETLQSFCNAVWQKVADHLESNRHEKLLSDPMTKTNALSYASQLWSGEHKKGLCLDREKATTIVTEDILREAARYEAIEKASV